MGEHIVPQAPLNAPGGAKEKVAPEKAAKSQPGSQQKERKQMPADPGHGKGGGGQAVRDGARHLGDENVEKVNEKQGDNARGVPESVTPYVLPYKPERIHFVRPFAYLHCFFCCAINIAYHIHKGNTSADCG